LVQEHHYVSLLRSLIVNHHRWSWKAMYTYISNTIYNERSKSNVITYSRFLYSVSF
jgi:hypothetical protein